VKFKGKAGSEKVDLGGWIVTGGPTLAPLRKREYFLLAEIINWGAALSWDKGEGDLSIDAVHLKKISDEQKPFTNGELRAWQSANNVSNVEAADFVGVSPSWNTYRVEAKIPQAVAIALQATERDPLLLQAHLKPRTAGRPRKEA
jgi:hypothetical protein